MNKLSRLFLAAFLCFNFAKAELPFEAIQGSGSCIKPEYQRQAAPLYGFVALNTYLKNLRFYGAYGPKNPEVLSPEYKTRPENDCPQDHVASLIQWLFPSFDGHNFVANQLYQDFVRGLTPELIGTILRTIIETPLDGSEESALIFAETIDRQKNPEAYTKIIAGFKNKPEGEAKQTLIRQSIASRLGSKKCKNTMLFSRILTRALTEAQDSDLYPEHTIEQALLAYFWKKAQNNADQQALLSALGADICAPRYASNAAPFSKEAYFELAKQFKKKPEDTMQTIFSNPELTAFTGYGWWAYENDYPPLSSFADATFKGKEYPNCGANTIRNFFNIFCYNKKTKTFDIKKFAKNIKKKKGQLSQKVIDYYLAYPTPSSQHSNKSIDDWSDIISDLPGVKYLKTPAGFDHPACEMDAGVSNTIHALNQLITSKKITEIAKSNKKTEEKSADTFTQMMKLFSNDEKTWEWSVGEDETTIKKDTDIIINFSCEDESIFDYHFDAGHFYIEYSEKKGRRKWNAEAFECAEKTGFRTPRLLSNLFLYHKPLKWLKKQENLEAKQQDATLFSGNLYSAEYLPRYIDYILKNELAAFYPLFNNWVAKLPLEDTQMRHKLYKIFKKHPDVIPPLLKKPMEDTQFIEDLCAAIKVKDIAQVKQLLTSYPHTPQLLNTPNLKHKVALGIAIKVKSRKSITALYQLGQLGLNDQEDYRHPLIFATSCGNVKVIQHVIKTWGMERKEILSLRTYEKGTLLHTCAEDGKAAALEFFINTYAIKRKFIMKTNRDKNTILHLAAKNGHPECLRTVIDSTQLSKADIMLKNEKGQTALLLAGKKGRPKCFNILRKLDGAHLSRKEIMKPNGSNETLLHKAAQTGDLEFTNTLVEMGNLSCEDIRFRPNHHESALILAIQSDHPGVAQFLIERGGYTREEILRQLRQSESSCELERSEDAYDSEPHNYSDESSTDSYDSSDEDEDEKTPFSTALEYASYKTLEMLIKRYDFLSDDILPLLEKEAENSTIPFENIKVIYYSELSFATIRWCIEHLNITKKEILGKTKYETTLLGHLLNKEGIKCVEEIISLLNITKSDFMKPDESGLTYLHYAIMHATPEIIAFIFEAFKFTAEDIARIDKYEMTLYQCSRENPNKASYDVCNEWVHFSRAQILETDKEGKTVFHRAADNGDRQQIRKSIKLNQVTPDEILQTDDEGLTALEYALRSGDWNKPTQTFQCLLKYGRIKRQHLLQTDATGTPLIHKLAPKLNEKQLKTLVKTCELLPEDLKIQNAKGQTPLHYAIETCADYDCLKALLEIGAYTAEDTIQKDNKGQSAWGTALANNEDSIILLLTEHLTAEIILDTDEKGCTSFHRSIQEANSSWDSPIKTLLCIDRITTEHILRTNNTGDNVLHLAAKEDDEFEDDLKALITIGKLTPEQILMPDGNRKTILEYKNEYGDEPYYVSWVQEYIANFQD